MRCSCCDASDVGLSNYRPDGRYSAQKFHPLPDGSAMCDECYYEGEEVLDMYNLEETLKDEEDGAFEYE